ncbi:MAG: hypothetical protein RLZZ480_372 [Candidatus Parcubacteria bacterium]|jgi:hypothetical protein
MNMVTDHAFHIGEQHLRNGKPCQDYALSGKLSDAVTYAIVSDGCSSGGQTDIGARLVALATERAIRECVQQNIFAPASINAERDLYIEAYRRTLQLPLDDFLATSLWAIVEKDSLLVSVTGDGAFALIFENDTEPLLYDISWDKSAPYYPAYRLGGMNERFKQHHENLTPLTITKSQQVGEGEPSMTADQHYIEPGMNGLAFTFSRNDDLFTSRICGVALFSDGVTQVDETSTSDVIRSLLSFKSTTGQFFTRRMNRFLQDVRKVGRGPLDDIAGAVIHFEP